MQFSIQVGMLTVVHGEERVETRVDKPGVLPFKMYVEMKVETIVETSMKK